MHANLEYALQKGKEVVGVLLIIQSQGTIFLEYMELVIRPLVELLNLGIYLAT